ncbi:MAG: hypothetical protein V2B18_05060 [Pseudomonadota bacterium]
MERSEILKKLAERRFEHFESLGLPPFKCRQLVTEKASEWKKLPDEELRLILEKGEDEY